MKPHIEQIGPREKIDPRIGGTGYLPPFPDPSTDDVLETDLLLAALADPLKIVIWKVARRSVTWRKWATHRRLLIRGRRVECRVIGSTKDWWFVSIDAAQAAKRLVVSTHAKEPRQ